jgi:hypothetical protein
MIVRITSVAAKINSSSLWGCVDECFNMAVLQICNGQYAGSTKLHIINECYELENPECHSREDRMRSFLGKFQAKAADWNKAAGFPAPC